MAEAFVSDDRSTREARAAHAKCSINCSATGTVAGAAEAGVGTAVGGIRMRRRERAFMTRHRTATLTGVSRIFTTSVASVYPHYVTKVEKKGRTKAELDQVIEWLTGFDESELRAHLASETSFSDFFEDAHLNPRASSITGVVCGIRVENIDDPLMQKIRYLDKLVDELARGKAMEKILRA